MTGDFGKIVSRRSQIVVFFVVDGDDLVLILLLSTARRSQHAPDLVYSQQSRLLLFDITVPFCWTTIIRRRDDTARALNRGRNWDGRWRLWREVIIEDTSHVRLVQMNVELDPC